MSTEPEPPTQASDRPITGSPVLVAGATGYIGRRLVADLVAAGHRVRCLARTPGKLDAEPWRDRVEIVTGDVLDRASLDAAFAGVGAAYYLVHSIGADPEWEARDRLAAETFRDAAATAGVGQIIYLGGLGDDAGGTLSPHLASRHEVGNVLGAGPVPLTELRAAVVIGSGSASFEMLRHLVEVLPIMTTPRWVETRVQPIAVSDVLAYLTGVLGKPEAYGRVFEVGGADVLTYREMMHLYAEVAGLRRRVILPVPVLSPRLSSLWVGLVTPLPVDLARPLIDSLVNEVIVRDPAIDAVVPHQPMGTREAIELALQRVTELEVSTRWTDAELFGRSPADPIPTDPQWSGATVFVDEQRVVTDAAAEAVYAQVTSLGGERGWLVGNWLWSIRGLLDLAIGGIGLRRGRRHPTYLRVGDVVDFWRVEALEPGRHLRLRAEMRLPGAAWLEWRCSPTADGGTVLEQRALFRPRGLAGRAYWYAVAPFHLFLFGPLARRITRDAAARPGRLPEGAAPR
ncbi:MAG: SDR family oxidoreductase [Actinomycetota bacterium]